MPLTGNEFQLKTPCRNRISKLTDTGGLFQRGQCQFPTGTPTLQSISGKQILQLCFPIQFQQLPSFTLLSTSGIFLTIFHLLSVPLPCLAGSFNLLAYCSCSGLSVCTHRSLQMLCIPWGLSSIYWLTAWTHEMHLAYCWNWRLKIEAGEWVNETCRVCRTKLPIPKPTLWSTPLVYFQS